MVVTSYVYHCGCGYRTSSPAQAIEHVRKTGHTMEIHGKVAEEKPQPQRSS